MRFVLLMRRLALWTISLALVACVDLGLVCAFLGIDFATPGSEVGGGLISGMLVGLMLSTIGQVASTLPSPSLLRKFSVVSFAGLATAVGMGLAERLGAGFGARLDRTIVDIFLLGTVAGFWSAVLTIDSLPAIKTVLRPRFAIPTVSLLGLGLAVLLWRVPLNSTKVFSNAAGVGLCLPLGLYVGLAVGRVTMPILLIIAVETKRPLRYIRILWRPLTSFLLVYGFLVVAFAAAYAALYNHYGKGMFVFPSDQGVRPRFGDFAYFSMMTISTVGYGDIYPVNWAVRVLAAAEVLLGIMWIVVYFALMMKYLEGEIQRVGATTRDAIDSRSKAN